MIDRQPLLPRVQSRRRGRPRHDRERSDRRIELPAPAGRSSGPRSSST